MKNLATYLLVGTVGYFVGFYEYKYKMQKALLDTMIKMDKERRDNKDQ